MDMPCDKTLHCQHPNTVIRCGLMIAKPCQDWNVLKQICVDHGDEFTRVYPRYDTRAYDGLVDKRYLSPYCPDHA
ncbi:hypothetical protein NKDENANG_03504 [Candidatus Entotheonellaceae bacterium PAL068K]